MIERRARGQRERENGRRHRHPVVRVRGERGGARHACPAVHDEHGAARVLLLMHHGPGSSQEIEGRREAIGLFFTKA